MRKVQNMDPWSMDRLRVLGPPIKIWTGSMGPPIMDWVHGPTIYTTPKITVLNNKIKIK